MARGWDAVAAEEAKAQGGQTDDAYGVEATREARAESEEEEVESGLKVELCSPWI